MKPITLVFSTGRSGTTLLAKLLSSVKGSYAENNYMMRSPDDRSVDDRRFSFVRGLNKKDPSIGYEFVGKFLERVDKDKCSHFTYCGSEIVDGFLEHFWAHGVSPSIIILRREPRKVALSLLLLGWAPVPDPRWEFEGYFAYPTELGVLPYHGWENAHPYQCAFWYCCYVEWKIWKYEQQFLQHKTRVWETTLNQILDVHHFNKMLTFLNLPYVDSIPQQKINSLDSHKFGEIPSPDALTRMESEVLKILPDDFRSVFLSKIW